MLNPEEKCQLSQQIIDLCAEVINDSYNFLRYNYFTKLTMSQRLLTQEEANKLLETCLILICQQNSAQKQKSKKNKVSTFTTCTDVSAVSPTKKFMKEARQQSFELPAMQEQFDLLKSPIKKVMRTPHKLSIERESTVLDLSDLSQQPQFKLMEKQESCLQLFYRSSITSLQQEIKRPSQIKEENLYKDSQLPEPTAQRLYTQSSVKDLKRELQIESRGKICKTQNMNPATGQIQGYHFLCKNDSDCPFNCYLEYSRQSTAKGEKIYKLICQNQKHLKSCIQQEEEISFMKLTKAIDQMEASIRKLLSQDVEIKPKDILMKIAEQLGESDHKFIYKGLKSKNYHKAAKKYFDNLIYKVKNPNWATL